MFKVLGSGLAVAALGAGIYYWWHDHHKLEGQFGDFRNEVEGTAREIRDRVEHS